MSEKRTGATSDWSPWTEQTPKPKISGVPETHRYASSRWLPATSFVLVLMLTFWAALAWSGEPQAVLVDRLAGLLCGAIAWQLWRGIWR